MYRQVLVVGDTPDRQQNTGGGTRQAVYLRNGWDLTEQRAKLDEPFTIEAERKHARIVLSIIKQTTNDVSLIVRDSDVKIARNSIDNMLVKAQALDYLLKNEIRPLTAITVHGLFSGPEKAWTQDKPYMDTIFKTQEQLGIEVEKGHALELLKTKQAETVKTGEAE